METEVKDEEKLFNLIFGKLEGINFTKRFSGSLKQRNQTVATHSLWTAIIAGALVKYENAAMKKAGELLAPYDLVRVYEQAIFHDADEVLTGDINHLFKHDEKSNLFKKELDSLLAKVVPEKLFNDNILFGEEMFKNWKDSQESINLHYFIKMGDWLQLLQYATEEYNMGNKYFAVKIRRVFLLISELNEKFLVKKTFHGTPKLIKSFLKFYFESMEEVFDDEKLINENFICD